MVSICFTAAATPLVYHSVFIFLSDHLMHYCYLTFILVGEDNPNQKTVNINQAHLSTAVTCYGTHAAKGNGAWPLICQDLISEDKHVKTKRTSMSAGNFVKIIILKATSLSYWIFLLQVYILRRLTIYLQSLWTWRKLTKWKVFCMYGMKGRLLNA